MGIQNGVGLSGADAGGQFNGRTADHLLRRAEGIPGSWRSLARNFNSNFDQVLGFDQVPPFYSFGGFFAKGLLLTMNWLHDVTKLGYGWVIVLITVLLKLIFWPLTAASTRSMKRMQALAPEVKALKEKYKDDPQKFTSKQMELWKKTR